MMKDKYTTSNNVIATDSNWFIGTELRDDELGILVYRIGGIDYVQKSDLIKVLKLNKGESNAIKRKDSEERRG